MPPARRVGAPLPPPALVQAGATRVAAARKPRPDPAPLRLAIGLAGVATASALVSAFLSPSSGVTAAAAGVTTRQADTTTTDTTGAVRHITRYVQLRPGQTAPPNVVVQAAPTPKPRVVVVRTRQSGG